ncbi:MAG: glycosyltransferase family 2 protein [Desulfomicrobium sp.]
MRFSVVVTSYNYGLFIREAINSVLSQTYKDFELIIIDDGSKDNTREIVSEFAFDERVKYFYQDNAGQPKAKNRGICESRGEFIAFLDADDVWESTKLEKQMPLFEDSDVGVVYSRRKWIDPVGVDVSGNERVLRRGMILDYIFIDNFVCFSSSVIRKSYLEEVGYFDESLPMGIDYDLWIRLACVCKFDFVDEALVRYRTGHSNLSKNTLKRYECAQKIMIKNLSNLKIKNAMAWYVPALAWSDTWSNFGFYLIKSDKKKQGLIYFFRAMAVFPLYYKSYRRFIKSLIFLFK